MILPHAVAYMALAFPALVHAQRFIGYYGKTVGDCAEQTSFAPESLPIDKYTHLNFAFALINDLGEIDRENATDVDQYRAINALKLKNPALRTALTVGGWDMKMAHYSEMVSTAEKRQKFIASAVAYVRQHGFDGLDFDWEYPSDPQRGGHDVDPENFVTFLKEMRDAANAEVLTDNRERLILSIALPGGPFHGKYFLIPRLAEYVDWFNIMAYNLHGPWESMVYCAAPLNDPANNTEYSGYSLVDAINAMAPKTVNPRKFNLGLSLSGVTFTLKDNQKTLPGSPAAGAGLEGCQEMGAMAYFEAKQLVDKMGVNSVIGASVRGDMSGKVNPIQNSALDSRHITQKPQIDDISKCMYMVVDGNQWVGFDTPETFAYKVDYLKNYGFGGVSIWSMDSDTASHDLTNSIHTSLNNGFIRTPFDNNSTATTSAGQATATAPANGATSDGIKGSGASPSREHALLLGLIASVVAPLLS
ncbi:hypothetical protein BGZ99_004742 [Dissophora globulifera]|uniref:GH18 domain-containing protein n=1 Tax=Dissophora globulifera TaxID=979702 RepID=A0A9P6RUN4_9FUNG|nr:hypothetical protein BGZ99_004742 [Dissophora globulifera]